MQDTIEASAPYPGKRLLDLAVLVVVAIPGLVIGALAAVAVWLDDGPPVLFRQVRAGIGGRPFILLKLRTMRHGRHALGPRAGAGGDPVTRAGRMMRRFSIDEIPQLINVARGEMSMVGPRPTLPYQVERYDATQQGRLRVLPGLTGLAQVRGRNRMTWAQRIEWDLRYIERQSLALDLAVLASTVRTVLTGDGVLTTHESDPIVRPRALLEDASP